MRDRPLSKLGDLNVCMARKSAKLINLASAAGVKLLPTLGFRIYNKKSNHSLDWVTTRDKNNVLLNSLKRQVAVFLKHGINELVFWHPDDSTRPDDELDWSELKVLSILRDALPKQ